MTPVENVDRPGYSANVLSEAILCVDGDPSILDAFRRQLRLFSSSRPRTFSPAFSTGRSP